MKKKILLVIICFVCMFMFNNNVRADETVVIDHSLNYDVEVFSIDENNNLSISGWAFIHNYNNYGKGTSNSNLKIEFYFKNDENISDIYEADAKAKDLTDVMCYKNNDGTCTTSDNYKYENVGFEVSIPLNNFVSNSDDGSWSLMIRAILTLDDNKTLALEENLAVSTKVTNDKNTYNINVTDNSIGVSDTYNLTISGIGDSIKVTGNHVVYNSSYYWGMSIKRGEYKISSRTAASDSSKDVATYTLYTDTSKTYDYSYDNCGFDANYGSNLKELSCIGPSSSSGSTGTIKSTFVKPTGGVVITIKKNTVSCDSDNSSIGACSGSLSYNCDHDFSYKDYENYTYKVCQDVTTTTTNTVDGTTTTTTETQCNYYTAKRIIVSITARVNFDETSTLGLNYEVKDDSSISTNPDGYINDIVTAGMGFGFNAVYVDTVSWSYVSYDAYYRYPDKAANYKDVITSQIAAKYQALKAEQLSVVDNSSSGSDGRISDAGSWSCKSDGDFKDDKRVTTTCTFGLHEAVIDYTTGYAKYGLDANDKNNYISAGKLFYIPLNYAYSTNSDKHFRWNISGSNIGTLMFTNGWSINANGSVDENNCYIQVENKFYTTAGDYNFTFRPVDVSNPFPDTSSSDIPSNWDSKSITRLKNSYNNSIDYKFDTTSSSVYDSYDDYPYSSWSNITKNGMWTPITNFSIYSNNKKYCAIGEFNTTCDLG